MRIIYLSNHPGEKLQAIRQRRQAAEDQEMARYREAVAQHQARVAEARRERAEARAQRRWWTWLRLGLSVLFMGADAPRRPGPSMGRSDQEEILAAGVAGELYVEDQLAPAFGDDWVLFRGYKNRRGEIDSVLLGPGGLFAMEVKNRNATVHVDGDNWWCDKYDRYGNLVEQGLRFVDRGGRSPSREVNEPADELERFLQSRRQPVAIRRAVILVHQRSVLGTTRNLTVDVATSMDWVIGVVRESRLALEAERLAELERLIVQDHRYHHERQTTR
jgi:Nuclease-related domain